MLREAQRRQPHRYTERIRWLRADAACLPFASGTVDACTGHSFLYLVANRSAVLSEARRVLKPGGRLVLMEPSAEAVTPAQTLSVSRDIRHLISISLWRPFSRLHGRFTPASLVSTLEGAGFVDCGADATLGGLGVLGWAAAPSP